MASMLSEPFITTTSFASRQNTLDSVKHFDDRDMTAFGAAHVSVITSTNSMTTVNPLDNSNNNISNENASYEQSEQKDGAKKPYGGRPLKYECPECQRRFHAPSHLKRHVMSHSSERPFQCDVCGKGFLQAWHLGRHMTTHTGNKPFKCVECAKSFGSRFEMKTHINYIHKGIKEHRCKECGKHFTLRSNLKVHMRKHTGEKPYQCGFCSKRFGQRGHLQYHIRKHEGTEDLAGNMQEHLTASSKGLLIPVYSQRSSVSDQSDCHDDDGGRDSGMGSYDSEGEYVSVSACSSPLANDVNDDQAFVYNSTSTGFKRPSSPEFGLLSQHQRVAAKRTSSQGNAPEVKPYVCYSCNCGFSEFASLRAHTRHSHPRKGIMIGDFRCAFCLRGFNSIESLHVHIQTHQMAKVVGSIDYDARPSKSPKDDYYNDKQKMSPKSRAFSIESICAETSSKLSPRSQSRFLYPEVGAPCYSSAFYPAVTQSMAGVLNTMHCNGMAARLSPTHVHSHQDVYCQCHLDMQHLHIH